MSGSLKSVDKKTKKALEELFGINARTAETSTKAILEENALEITLKHLPDSEEGMDDNQKKIVTLAIDVLLKMAMNVFVDEISEEQQKEIQKKINNIIASQRKTRDSNAGFAYLYNLHHKYKTQIYKDKLAVIIGRFFCGLNFPPAYHDILKILIKSLKNPPSAKDMELRKLNDPDYDEDDEDLNNITYCSLCALISISALTDNENTLIDAGVVEACIPLMTHEDYYLKKRASSLLKNICTTSDQEYIMKIVKTDIFSFYLDILTKILTAKSTQEKRDQEAAMNASQKGEKPPAPSTKNYLLIVEDIIKTVSFLVSNQKQAVEALLNSKLMPMLMILLQSTTSIIISPPVISDSNTVEQQAKLVASSREIQLDILRAFIWCSYFDADQAAKFMENDVISVLVFILNKYNKQQDRLKKKELGITDYVSSSEESSSEDEDEDEEERKERKAREREENKGNEHFIGEIVRDEVILSVAKICNNISNFGSSKPASNNKNSYYDDFDDASAFEALFKLFAFLQPIHEEDISPMQQETLYKTSLTLGRLFKATKPPIKYGLLLAYLDQLKTENPPKVGYNYPKNAGIIYNKIAEADAILDQYEKMQKEVQKLERGVK